MERAKHGIEIKTGRPERRVRRAHEGSVATGPASVPLLSARRLTKFFGSFAACDGIDLDVAPGEIHALLGENGAGKSTLVKMLFGLLQPSAGDILWQGAPVAIASPAVARELGIGMVFQHFSLFEALTVAENIALSLKSRRPLARVAEEAAALSRTYGLPLNFKAHVADLSVGERQRIEIVRALLQDPKLIILDEPTSVLTPQESERLFETLEKLKSEGRSVLYISHRLEEVRRLCDRATVLRQGRVVAVCDPRRETPASLARMMIGADVSGIRRSADAAPGEVQLQVSGLSMPARTPFAVPLADIAFEIRAGEVLAIAGIAGNGQSELFDALSGEVLLSDDEVIRIRGRAISRSGVSARRLLGAAFVPEERHGHAAIGALRLSDNLLLARNRSDARAFLAGGPLAIIRRRPVRRASARVCAAMDVRKNGDDPPAASLSGGNLQKFVVGRELDREPALLVVNQPTWGVDAGAARHIRQALLDLAAAGSAVLVISQDMDEIREIATRIAVLSRGRLSCAYPATELTAERIGLMMGGLMIDDRMSSEPDADPAPSEAAHAH